MHTIIVKNASKNFNKATVLHNINLELSSEKVYGFVGRNGSGKSMLFRLLSGLIRPTAGEIIVDGKVLHKETDHIERLGIIMENAGLYKEYTAMENLKYLANFNKYITEDEIRHALERVGLDTDERKTVRKYSLGMKQRLIIAQAIMEKPDFILLDEPTNALDVKGVELMRTIVKEEKERGALILIASHNSEDIQILCDAVYHLSEGTIEETSRETAGF